MLDIEEHHTIGIFQQQAAGAGIEDVVAIRNLDLLGDLVLEILDDDLKGQDD